MRHDAESLEADIPTLYDHFERHLQRPDVLEQLKSSDEGLNPFIVFVAMLGLLILKVEELPPSRAYEPWLIQHGVNPIVARGMARIVIRHGERRAAESGWHRRVIESIRFLTEPGRRRQAILRRAQILLAAWEETSLIETVFDEVGLIETEFIGLLKAVVEGGDVDCQRITEIAGLVAPHFSLGRGPKISAASAAHEFFLAGLVRITGVRAYTWSTLHEDFTDSVTEATRVEFDEPDFDPRPARRRMREGRGVKID